MELGIKDNKKIRLFTDLYAWKESHKLILEIYRLTRAFPREEIFGLTSQMRRAAVSITSNIAEGFGRQKYNDKLRFYYIAHGSLIELKNQLMIARDVSLIDANEYEKAAAQSDYAHKFLQGLIVKTKSYWCTAS